MQASHIDSVCMFIRTVCIMQSSVPSRSDQDCIVNCGKCKSIIIDDMQV